jgi:hypothetical protein
MGKGAATQEISRNVQQAAQGTQQVSANISDMQRGASEAGSASSQVLSAAKSLSGDSNRLKLEVGKIPRLGQGRLRSPVFLRALQLTLMQCYEPYFIGRKSTRSALRTKIVKSAKRGDVRFPRFQLAASKD